MSWTCKCCTVIFAERADFDKHKTECRAIASTKCTKCGESFKSTGYTAHLADSICGLRSYDVEDLYYWASEVNKKRLTVLVKEYHRNIMAAVANGRFCTRLPFIYADDKQSVRDGAMSSIVSELKKLFADVDIKVDQVGNFIDVAWTKTAVFCSGIKKNSFFKAVDSEGPKKDLITDDKEPWVDFWQRVNTEETEPKTKTVEQTKMAEQMKMDFKKRMAEVPVVRHSSKKALTSINEMYSGNESIPEYDWAKGTAVKKQVPEAIKRAIWEKHIGSKQELPLSDEEQEQE